MRDTIIRICFLFTGLLSIIHAQQVELRHKQVGVYLSSKAVSFSEEYHIWINQFLSLENDRSWEENQKTEFLIRLGQRWAQEVQRVSGADTVIFLNGDLELGKTFLAEGPQALVDQGRVEVVLSLDSLRLKVRRERVSFIRSNRLLVSKRTIRHANLHTSLYQKGQEPQYNHTCFDEFLHKFPPELLNFYTETSALGKFCTAVYSRWWLELYAGEKSRCSN